MPAGTFEGKHTFISHRHRQTAETAAAYAAFAAIDVAFATTVAKLRFPSGARLLTTPLLQTGFIDILRQTHRQAGRQLEGYRPSLQRLALLAVVFIKTISLYVCFGLTGYVEFVR